MASQRFHCAATCSFHLPVNSLNAPRQGACAVLDILKLLLRGVWTGRRTCWSGSGRKSGTVCCFFPPKTNTHRKPTFLNLWSEGWSSLDGKRSTAGDNALDAAEGLRLRTVTSPCLNWSKFERSRSFFFLLSPLLTFELSDFVCRFLQGPGTEMGTGLD